MLLFDYLQQNKQSSIKSSNLRKTIIKVPDNIDINEAINFDAPSIFDFLNGHFDQSTHFISNMISIFHQNFYSKNQTLLSIHIEDASDNSDYYKRMSQELMKEVKSFMIIVLKTMIYYYGGLLAKKMQENPNEMYDFIIEKVITKEIHDILIQSYNLSNPVEYIHYQKKIESLENTTCKDIEIDALFCLDTVDGMNTNGYEFVIAKVRGIKDMLTPMKKLEVISNATDLISDSVIEF